MNPISESVQEEAARQDRRKAMRALLRRPLITAEGKDADVFPLIRRHAAWLREWLARNTGWGLYVDSEIARLRKTPPDLDDPTRGASPPGADHPFTRRRYALVCLALAALEQGERQTTLQRLFEAVIRMSALDPALEREGMLFDPERYDHRRDLVQAVRFLMRLRILNRVDGDERAYLNQKGDALYNVNRHALAAVLSVRRAPSTVAAGTFEDRLRAIVAEPMPETAEGHNRRIRFYLTRKLLDDPVLYVDRLNEAERAYYAGQRPKITSEINLATGLIPETRLEGTAMIDEAGDVTDMSMPEDGTEGHLTLLTAEFLAERLKAAGSRPVGHAGLRRRMESHLEKYGSYWRREAREPGALDRLTRDAVSRLRALDLVEIREDGIVPLPAIARYALEGTRITGSKNTFPEQGLLF